MNLTYKKATMEDIDVLTETRIEVLRAANQLSDDIDLSEVQEQSYHYYQKPFAMVHILPVLERPLYEKYGFVKMNDEMELPKFVSW